MDYAPLNISVPVCTVVFGLKPEEDKLYHSSLQQAYCTYLKGLGDKIKLFSVEALHLQIDPENHQNDNYFNLCQISTIRRILDQAGMEFYKVLLIQAFSILHSVIMFRLYKYIIQYFNKPFLYWMACSLVFVMFEDFNLFKTGNIIQKK